MVFLAQRPLKLLARREVGAMLIPPHRAHPWPERIPSLRFGQLPGDLVDYPAYSPLAAVRRSGLGDARRA